jgi:hypothetical protein
MSLRRRIVVSIVATATSALAACGDSPEGNLGPSTFGPESLHVAIIAAPDTVTAGADLIVGAVARNATTRPITVVLPCLVSGFVVRLGTSQDQTRDLPRPSCVVAGSGALSIAPGDSVVASVRGTSPTELGTYRLTVGYEAGSARAAPATRSLVTRSAPCKPNDAFIVMGIAVALRDSTTGKWLNGVVSATDGTYQEAFFPGPGTPGSDGPDAFLGVRDRPGTYSITASAPGYKPWRLDNVVVAQGADCHVVGVRVTARLQPS